MGWREELTRIMEKMLEGGGEVVLIGVGNPLRGDDGVGVEIARSLKRSLRSDRIRVLIMEDRIDLIPRMLKDMTPEIILIFDAADFGGKPGEIRLMSPEESIGKTISTHELPLGLILKIAEISAPAYILGIQVETLEFGEAMSPAVRASADEVSSLLLDLLAGK